jgi:hypothetical protein
MAINYSEKGAGLHAAIAAAGAGRAAVTAVSAATTKAQVDAVVPSWPA